ncbi:MAG: glycosyltransferase [Acidobacteriota bacterium]|nr:glycosyltransferase [Acidobacteriota bacterium]
MARVAIVIVTFNSGTEIGECLDSLSPLRDVEIVVVDNASNDETKPQVAARNVRLIANPDNAGFAAAVNQGVRATAAPLLLLLNPDASLKGGLEALVAEFDHPQTGAAGGLLTSRDGHPQQGFMSRNLPSATLLILEVLGINRLWPRNPANWHYRCLDRDTTVRGLVEQPAGAFFMFSRHAWEQVRGFDERFWPIWFEDVDFCCQLRSAGYLVYFNPLAVATHTGGHSITTLPLEKKERYWYGSLLKYAGKHYRAPAYKTVCFAVALSAALRAVIAYPRGGSRVFAVYGAVCRLAIGRFWRQERGSERVLSSEWRENS